MRGSARPPCVAWPGWPGAIPEVLRRNDERVAPCPFGLAPASDRVRHQLRSIDEPSLGLAPILVREIFGIIRELHRQGLTIFLVEQNVHHAIRVADYCYVIENGRVVREGSAADLEADPAIRQAYLGL